MKDEIKHAQLNKEKWDKWASSYDSNNWRNKYLRDAQSKLVSYLDVKDNVRFLDLGCGTGWAIGETAKLVGNKGEFYGIDLSEKMIEKAKSNYRDRDNFHFIEASAESMPLNNNFFDIIICTNSFHHYLHPDKVLKEIYRLLKKGGKIYILDPTADSWIIKIIDKIIKLAEPEHVKLYSTKEFRLMFEKAQLKYSIAPQTFQAASKVHIGEK